MSTMRQAPERLLNAQFFAGPPAPRVRRHRLTARFAPHWHEFYELTVVLGGAGWNTLNGERQALTAGSAWLCTPADFHTLEPAPGGHLDLVNALFVQALLDDDIVRLLFERPLARHVDFSPPQLQQLDFRLAFMAQEQEADGAGRELLLRGELYAVLVAWHRQRRAKKAHASGAPLAAQLPAAPDCAVHPGIQKALIYIQHHFRQPLALDDAADQAHLSTNYFSELFHSATGCTFQRYLQRLRLQFAHGLLQSSALPVTEVALAAGFNTLTHFVRVFRQAYGLTPGQVSHAGQDARR
jgi:AraC-like DNA-binding protein